MHLPVNLKKVNVFIKIMPALAMEMDLCQKTLIQGIRGNGYQQTK